MAVRARSVRGHQAVVHTGFSEVARGILTWLKGLDGRWNGDVLPIFTGHPFFAPSTYGAFAGASQGKGGDCLRRGPEQVPPRTDVQIPGLITRAPWLISQAPGIVNIQILTNDISLGRSVAQLIDDYDTLVEMLTSAGIWVVLNTVTWNSAMTPGSTTLARAEAMNDWVVAQSNRRGVKLLDTRALDGPRSGVSAAYFFDGTHPTAALQRLKVRDYLAPIMRSMVAAGEFRSADPLANNLFPALGLVGITGTKTSSGGGTVTGDVATGIAVAKTNNASSLVCSKEVVSAGVEKQVITINAAADATTVHTATVRTTAALMLAAAGLALGDWIEVAIPIEVSDWAGFDLADTNGINALTISPVAALASAGTTAELFAVGSGASARGYNSTLRFVMPIPAELTTIDRLRLNSVFLNLRWMGGAAGSGTIKIGAPIIRKIANAKTAWNL